MPPEGYHRLQLTFHNIYIYIYGSLSLSKYCYQSKISNAAIVDNALVLPEMDNPNLNLSKIKCNITPLGSGHLKSGTDIKNK
jgi:hypothetical protein